MSTRPSISRLLPENPDKWLKDFDEGPLSAARSSASFNWRSMKKCLYKAEVINYVYEKLAILEREPVFVVSPIDFPETREGKRALTKARYEKLVELELFSEMENFRNPDGTQALSNIINQIDPGLAVKRAMSQEVFALALRMNGRKMDQLISDIWKLNESGAMMITELGHGSDTKGFLTRAEFDKETQELVLHSPCVEATKVWSGNLGQTATKGIVFAQLYSNGKHYGLQQFLVPLRDQNGRPYTGVEIGDMGPKAGLDGLDNGWARFDHYRLPLSSWLSKRATFDADGNYVSKSKTVKAENGGKKNQGATLGALSIGRIGIIMHASLNLTLATTIAIRYNFVRQLFDESANVSKVAMNHAHIRELLLPHLAHAIVYKVFYDQLSERFYGFIGQTMFGEISPELAQTGQEIHVLSCAGKACATWRCMEGLRVALEGCGEHAYLTAARLGELRNDFDPNVTFEGDNTVILQQTSNYLLKVYEEISNGNKIVSHLDICSFLNDIDAILSPQRSFRPSLSNIDQIIEVYQYFICSLLRTSSEKFNQLGLTENHVKDARSQFVAKNESQVYYLRDLSIAFFELNAMNMFQQFTNQVKDSTCRQILEFVNQLYALHCLQSHFNTILTANCSLISDKFSVSAVHSRISDICERLAPEAIALTDCIAPPDFVVRSILGYSDGRIYERLEQLFAKANQKNLPPPSLDYRIQSRL